MNSKIDRRTTIVSSLTAIIAVSLSALPTSAADLKSDAEPLIAPYIDAGILEGLSIGIIKGDQTATLHYGKVNDRNQTPDDNTIYEIGSISKVFTGVLLADAIHRGKVNLDDAAQAHAPPGAKFPAWEETPIRLIDLATHTSGLPRLPDNMPFSDPANPYADYTSKLALEFLAKHKLHRAPEAKGEYSNFGTSLLGYLLCQSSDLKYHDLLTDRILKPLGMKSSGVQLSLDQQKRFAAANTALGVPAKPWDFADLPGAGGIRSTTRDMLVFAHANLGPPDNEVGKALKLAWKNQRMGAGFEMGLGWHIAKDGETRWHNGQTGGYHSMLMINRPLKTAVVLLTNTATSEVDQLAEQLMRQLAGGKETPRVFDKSINVSNAVMQTYVGLYELAPGVNFDVQLKEGKLMVRLANQPSLQVFAKTPTEWFYKAVKASITFQTDDDGNVTALELSQNGAQQTAKRIPVKD